MITQHAIEHPLILVVEDEALLRLNAVDMLEDAGFDVIEAGNADEALRLIETNGDVRLVFTDVNMPGKLDGLDLVRNVHERWPDIRLIVTSALAGLSDEDVPDDGRFVPKPYDGRRLIGMVDAMVRAA